MKKITYLFTIFTLALYTTSCDKKSPNSKESKAEESKAKAEKEGSYELNNEGVAIVDKIDSSKIAEINTALYIDSQNKYHYIYNLEKGKSYNFSTRNVETYTASNGKKNLSQTNETTDKLLFTVKEDKGSYYVIEAKFISSKMKASADGKSIVYDTDQAAPKEEELKKDWKLKKALMGNTFQFNLTKTGTASNFSGLDVILKKIESTMSKELSKEGLSNLMSLIKEGIINPKVLKEQFETTMVKFPKDGAKLGETWTDKSERGTTTFKFSKIEGENFVINLSASLPTDTKSKTQQGVTASFTVSGNTNGTLNINKNTGWVTQGQYTKTMSAKTTMAMGDKSQTRNEKRVMTSYINQ